ncbi:MAG: 16S rRNA methyltransferase [Synechococcaceae cyanobacterium SM2_3_1]|nr:16S rRNA methyltransferase [Synechococcaceae cyanobacterium SM2_3_1]
MNSRSPDPLQQLLTSLSTSSKYRHLSPDLIRAIGAEELEKRKQLKAAIKATKAKLHQIGGAYLASPPNYQQWRQELVHASGHSTDLRTTCQRLMNHHLSTRERIPILEPFYQTLFQHLPPIHSVLDLACGLNPLAVPWMSLSPGVTYYACDIYVDMMEFIADALQIMGIGQQTWVQDISHTCPQLTIDVAFLLKTLPCLEHQQKYSGLDLLRGLRTSHLVVSFPAHSLTGKSKGMLTSYDRQFRAMIRDEGWSIQQFCFATEMVYIVTKP